MRTMAIDPGVRAAAALLDHGGGTVRRFVDMVDIKMLPDGERKQLAPGWFGDLLEKWEPDVVVLENVQVAVFGAGPDGQRKSAMSPSDAMRFGLSCGELRGFVKAYQIPIELVHPRTWTRHFGVKGGAAEKKNHILKLKEIEPSCRHFIRLQADHGMADAGLMAIWYAETKRELL